MGTLLTCVGAVSKVKHAMCDGTVRERARNMNGRIQTRLALLAALAALVAVLVPAGLAFGDHPDLVRAPNSEVIELELGATDQVTWSDTATTQSLNLKKNCTVEGASGALLDISAIGGTLGNDKDGLGVRSAGDGRGEPCGRTEASDGEAISVSLGSSSELDSYLMSAVDFDLELKFNASIAVSYQLNGSEVATDTFNPAEGGDDGPDSTDGDNYRYRHRPTDTDGQILFDQVIFTPTAGSFSLEGGADLAAGAVDDDSYGDLATPQSYTSQIELLSNPFDGEITCGDSLTIQNPEGTLIGDLLVHSMQLETGGPWNLDPDCRLKPYNASATLDTLIFVPELEGTSARYTIAVEVQGQTVSVDETGQITSLIALYDPEGDSDPEIPLMACLGEPIDDPAEAGYAAFWQQADVGLLPDGESACWYDSSVSTTGESIGTEFWRIYFEDDPGIAWR